MLSSYIKFWENIVFSWSEKYCETINILLRYNSAIIVYENYTFSLTKKLMQSVF